jgi:hypothetical protein
MPITPSPSPSAEARVAKSNRNASDKWNGFSYQAKVGLLIGLLTLKAKQVDNDDELKRWYFDFEVSEDVVVGNQNGTISKHQVKAMSSRSSHLYSSYSEAINDFEVDGVPENARFLHTATEVTDFQENDKKVQLYTYPDGKSYCKLADDQVFSFCIDEIMAIRAETSDTLAKDIAYFLMHQIAAVINRAHVSLDGSGTIIPARISLFELKSFIFQSLDAVTDALEEVRLKNSILEIWDTFREYTGGEELDNDQLIKVDAIIAKLTCFEYEEILDFLCFIHPHINFIALGRNISVDGLKDVFLEALMACTPEYDCSGGLYKVNGEYYVPTAISRVDSPKNRKDVAEGIINNYSPGSKRLLFERSSIINASIEGDLIELAELNNRKYSPNEKGLEHIMSYTGTRLTNLSNAINSINQERGRADV